MWQQTKDYTIEVSIFHIFHKFDLNFFLKTRVSDKGLLMCKSVANVNIGIDKFMKVLTDKDSRSIWDQNYDSGHVVQKIGDNTQI